MKNYCFVANSRAGIISYGISPRKLRDDMVHVISKFLPSTPHFPDKSNSGRPPSLKNFQKEKYKLVTLYILPI